MVVNRVFVRNVVYEDISPAADGIVLSERPLRAVVLIPLAVLGAVAGEDIGFKIQRLEIRYKRSAVIDHTAVDFYGLGLVLVNCGVNIEVLGGGVAEAVELVLLEGIEGDRLLLVAVADVLIILIPAVERMASLAVVPELVIREIALGDVIGLAGNLFASLIEDMVVHRVYIPHHGDDVFPAVYVDFFDARITLGATFSYVIVPGSVVEPAFILKTCGEIGLLVIVIDVEVCGLYRLAVLILVSYQISGIGCRSIAVAVDLDLYGLILRLRRLLFLPNGVEDGLGLEGVDFVAGHVFYSAGWGGAPACELVALFGEL